MSVLDQQQRLQGVTLEQLFASDTQRFANMHLQTNGILMDYSKQLLTVDTIAALCEQAKKIDLSRKINDLFSGAIVNSTEQRPALHTALRDPETTNEEINTVLDKMHSFVATAHKNFSDVIVLGIGGSDLGPRLVCEALSAYKLYDINLHFIANVDGDTLMPLLSTLDPKKTLCIINSKTFTTIETLANAGIVRSWLKHDN